MSCRIALSLMLAAAAVAFAPPSHHSSLCRNNALAQATTSSPHSPTQTTTSRKWRPSSALAASSDLPDFDDDEYDRQEENPKDAKEEEAKRLQEKAAALRDQIRAMESQIGDGQRERYNQQRDDGKKIEEEEIFDGKSLKNKRVLILGANGRVGSMITRYLLRTYGSELKEVVAAVHYVGQATTRGYGRLSYEVGAEDGVGTIGAAWSGEEERNAQFKFDPEIMGGYYLNKLRIVEVELLDPVQVRTITDDVDSVIFCATDFEGNRPRAVASLNAAFLFRAVAAPDKGRVEIEGLRNCLEGLAGNIKDKNWKDQLSGDSIVERKPSDPTQFVLVSTSPEAFGEFETPFGEFNGIKRQGEYILANEFPSISSATLQMGKYDDNFVEEGQEPQFADAEGDTVVMDGVIMDALSSAAFAAGKGVKRDVNQKRINRRDAARAAVEALLDEELEDKKVQVFTAVRKTDIW